MVFAAAAAAAATKLLQSCLTLCNPIDGSPPGSLIPGILRARTLEWVAISFSKMVYSVILRALKPTAIIVEISLTWWRIREAGDWGDFFLLPLHSIPSPISLLRSCPLQPIFSGLAPWSLKTSYCKLRYISSVQFSSVQLLSHVWLFATPWIAAARPSCPSPTPGVHPDSGPSSRWYHLAVSSSVVSFSSCPQSLPASESFPMSQLFAWGGQSTGASASASLLPKKLQGWSPSE